MKWKEIQIILEKALIIWYAIFFGMAFLGPWLKPPEYQLPTTEQFKEDQDILDDWFQKHGYAHFKATEGDFLTNGKHVWKLNMEIKRPRLDKK